MLLRRAKRQSSNKCVAVEATKLRELTRALPFVYKNSFSTVFIE